MASINYPIGMNLGGDPSQALVHPNPTASSPSRLSAIDLGQGMKQATRQISSRDAGRADLRRRRRHRRLQPGPHDMGSFASRGTHRVGNAVMVAAQEPRAVTMEAAAEELEVNAAQTWKWTAGTIDPRQGVPLRAISVKDVAVAAQFRQGKTIAGRGIFRSAVGGERRDRRDEPGLLLRARLSGRRPGGGRRNRRGHHAQDDQCRRVGPGHRPQDARAAVGRRRRHGHEPRPLRDAGATPSDIAHGPRDYNEYVMPGPGDICRHHLVVLERPAPDGPFGGKGPGEMRANPVLPAVANAIFNAVGVRIDELPITRKGVRAIKAQGGARPQGAPEDGGRPHGRARNRCPHRSPQALAHALRQRLLPGRRRPRHRRLPGAGAGQLLLLEGASVGRQDRRPPRPFSRSAARLIRLERHEGIDDGGRPRRTGPFPRQMVVRPPGRRQAGRYHPRSKSLIERPMLQALPAAAHSALCCCSARSTALYYESKALLLEFLSDFTISVRKRGTLSAPRSRPLLTPHLDLHARAALRARAQAALRLSFHRLPGARARVFIIMLARLQRLPGRPPAPRRPPLDGPPRREPLTKPPGIAEAVDWAEAAYPGSRPRASWPDAFKRSIGVAIKDEDDLVHIAPRIDAILTEAQA